MGKSSRAAACVSASSGARVSSSPAAPLAQPPHAQCQRGSPAQLLSKPCMLPCASGLITRANDATRNTCEMLVPTPVKIAPALVELSPCLNQVESELGPRRPAAAGPVRCSTEAGPNLAIIGRPLVKVALEPSNASSGARALATIKALDELGGWRDVSRSSPRVRFSCGPKWTKFGRRRRTVARPGASSE